MTPYRVCVFARGAIGRFKKIVSYGYDLWNPVQYFQEARLPSAGSFLWPGLHAVRRAAMAAFEQPDVHQVQVRTNQDRIVYIWNKHNGIISGYGYTKQEWRERI